MSTLGKYKNYLNLKGYSQNTINNYSYYINEFVLSFDKPALHITKNDIKDYLINYNYKSRSMQNIIISSMKLFCKYILVFKLDNIHELERPRKQKSLPRVIDQHELKSKIEAINNLKHKAILALAFSCSLRVSEVTNLKIIDIDSVRGIIHIRNAKGRKDRIVPLSENVLKILRNYYRQYKPVEYLFNGQLLLKYSNTSCNKIFKKYIDANGHFHLLRHSGLTALMENGENMRLIQSIAGHRSSRTTEIYTHVSNHFLQSVNLPI